VVNYTFWSPYLRRKIHRRCLLDRRLFDLPELVWEQWRAEIFLCLLEITDRKGIKTNNHSRNIIFIKL
jgi:hypothetical protein